MYIAVLFYLCLLQTANQLTVFSHRTAVCISVDGSYGVVSYNPKSIACASCQYGASKCKHVDHVRDLLQAESPPTCLKHWVLSALPKHEPLPCSSKSSAPIPWQSNPETLKTKHDTRFNIINEVAYLIPDSHSNCSKCGNKSWDDPFVVRYSFVVTDTFISSKRWIHLSIISV